MLRIIISVLLILSAGALQAQLTATPSDQPTYFVGTDQLRPRVEWRGIMLEERPHFFGA